MIVTKQDYDFAILRLEYLHAHYSTLESEEKAELVALTSDVGLYEQNNFYGKN